MKVDDVLKCSFDSWYELFASQTIESAIIPLPPEALDYLAADGILLDSGVSHGEEAAAHASDDPNPETLNPEFKAQINQAIGRLGGEDATWITPNRTLKCTNADEIFLLLKSSDFVVHDLSEPFLECEDVIHGQVPSIQYVLVLRKWIDMHRSNEFRCFVKDQELIAISQRHSDAYFPTLAENEDHRFRLKDTLVNFFDNAIKSRFPLANYAFDAYVDDDRILLLDFNPWGIVTDALLYNWNELNAVVPHESTKINMAASATSTKLPEFRVITDATIRPTDPYAGLYGVPLEYHRLATEFVEEGKPPFEALLDLMRDQCLNDDEDME